MWVSSTSSPLPPCKGKKSPTLSLVPITSQPNPHINIHCKSLCMGPEGTGGRIDSSWGKKSWVRISSYFFELSGLRGCCGFPPNHFSTSSAPKRDKKVLVQCKMFGCEGKKIPPVSFQLSPARSVLPCIDQAVICSLIHMGEEKKRGEPDGLVEVGGKEKFRHLLQLWNLRTALALEATELIHK